ncbi:reprolysin-like metallopeptidase [Lysobacter tyrosinilyticus]
MRVLLVAAAAILVVGGLIAMDRPDTGMPVTPSTASVGAAGSMGLRKGTSSVAAYPDRGQLLAYDQNRRVVHSSGSVWYPVQLSEAHALRAIAEGGMTVRAPNGELIRLNYERHFEHPDGNWTWVGRERGSAPGTETVLTFGEKAVFGVIRQGKADLKLTTEAGSTWLVDSGQADGSQTANVDDMLGLPNLKVPTAATSGAVVQQVAVMDAAQPKPTLVDIAVGFTKGFAARLGGDSQARTRVNFLLDVTNQAYLASGINAQVRLVHARQVDYPDDTSDRAALFDLTGMNCTEQVSGANYMSSARFDCAPITQSVGLQPLTAARETYGADLLVLVRKYVAPENVSCGSAWMLGGGQNPIDANSAAFGTVVVSDSSGDMFPSNGATCPDVHLAHELGHSFGQQHDVVSSMGSDDSDNDNDLLDPEEYGYQPYSFGYSTDGTASDIATIMSNRRPSQTRYRVFSNPLISSCGGAPCGTVEREDNAHSMSETMPLVAQFRATVESLPTPFVSLYAISKSGGGGFTDVNVLTGESWYQAFKLQAPTSLAQTDNEWQFALADFNHDDVPDLYSIHRQGASGHTEITVLDGAHDYQTSLHQVSTVLPVTGTGLEWVFRLGDYNRDGITDLYTIYRIGASGTTEVHVVDGATDFQTYLAHLTTGLPQTGTANDWQFGLADRNSDKVLDLYCINRAGAQHTEVRVFSGASGFQVPLLQVETALQPTGTGNEWNFKLADYNRDGIADIYAIYRTGTSGKTELHVLDGKSKFGQFGDHIATGLPTTGTDASWEFELWPH